MAIQFRGGLSSDLVKSKLRPREACITTDSGEMFYCSSAGNVKKVASVEDLQAILSASPEAFAAMQQLIADLELNPSEITNILNNISALQTGKLDNNGNSKDNTVTFTSASVDADIATGDSHATLFGKILKRFNVIATALGLKQAISNMVQTTAVNDATKYPSSAVSYSLAQSINTLNDNLAQSQVAITLVNCTNIDSRTRCYIKNSRCVMHICLVTSVDIAAGAALKIGSITSAYLPFRDVLCIVARANSPTTFPVGVLPNGDVVLYNYSGSLVASGASIIGEIIWDVGV